MSNKLELFVTDTHHPYADPAVWSLVLAVAKDLKPAIVWLNGDICDFYQASSFIKDPANKHSLQHDLDVTAAAIADLRKAAPNAEMHFKEGNHEQRLTRYLFTRAEELSGLRSLQVRELLGLNKVGCVYHKNESPTKVGRLWHLHGNEVPTGSVHPAQKMLRRVRDNVIFGHRHRFDVDHDRGISGSSHVAWAIGTTQLLTPEYDFHPIWDHGFALVEYAQSGFFHITPVEVFTEKRQSHCVVYGKLYSADVTGVKSLPKFYEV